MRKESYYPAEVIYICWLLNDTCEAIFGKPFHDLVLFRGPDNTIAEVKKRFKGASPQEKARLLSLLGIDSAARNTEESTTDKNTPINGTPGDVFQIIDIDLSSPSDSVRYGK
jgi:hypothetical protein